MANSSSATKRARQNEKRRRHNMAMRSKARTYVKGVLAAVANGNKEEAQKLYTTALPVIDNMVNKGIIHKNKAARQKSRLNKMLRAMEA
ncbi:MAG: 30S ribosomal protein S20 [Chromatiales bacterium]|nr:30S ribosomal protein S20 [Chromatiales bacterium]MDH4014720.1 30S ribosomal protein S20 [Chromatiales bacterium]PLX56381.1 MAG: 30S ribosomal protein S20 [Chromatiales bacterium]